MQRAAVAVAVMAMVGMLAPAWATAQTSDVFWGSSQWRVEVVGPAALGEGGAAVAITDDVTGMGLQPAVLSTLNLTQLAASGYTTREQTVLRGDQSLSRSGLGYIGGGARITPKIGIGGFIFQPRLVDTAFPSGGNLKSTVTDAGAAASLKVGAHLHVGAQILATHLALKGAGSRFNAAGVEVYRVGTNTGETRVLVNLGAIIEATRDLSFGVSAISGTSWQANRTAVIPDPTTPTAGTNVDLGSQYSVRRPRVIAGGFSWRPMPKIRFVGQLDFVAYSEVSDAFVLRDLQPSGSFTVENAVEPRAGIEISLPVHGVGSLQVRGGVHSRANAALTYAGSDAFAAAVFPGGERETVFSVGSSVVLRKLVFHVAAAGLGGNEPRIVIGGATLRF